MLTASTETVETPKHRETPRSPLKGNIPVIELSTPPTKQIVGQKTVILTTDKFTINLKVKTQKPQ
jgi:hypothetical protein